MSITKIQKRYITREITFEQKEGQEDDVWQVVEVPNQPFNIFDYVNQFEIDNECDPDI